MQDSRELASRQGLVTDLTLKDMAVLVKRRWRLVIGIPVVACLSALAVVLALPRWYVGTAQLLPPRQSQSTSSALLGQIGLLSGTANPTLGLKNPADIYIAMLRSRSIADRLIERFDLRGVYDEQLYEYARRELSRNSSISAGREGVITIEVMDREASRAAQLANGYIEELKSLTSTLAIGEASQRRLFFEIQLKNARTNLTNAELELEKFAIRSGLVSPASQIGLAVTAAASLKAQISMKEIQLATMGTFATEANPEMQRIRKEITGLRLELSKLDKRGAEKGDVLVPFGTAPEIASEYVRRHRDVKYQEALVEMLAKQFEIARIDEAKDATLIQVLDTALPPERATRPRRALVVGLSTLAGLLLALLAILADEKIRRNRIIA